MNDAPSLKDDSFVTFETHFGVPGHFIRATTRNKCSEDIASILQETARILYPDDEFEVFLFPPQPGSYKDIIKFVKKHKGKITVGTAIAVGGLAFAYLNYKDTHEEHLHDKKMWVIDDTQKCIELSKTIESLKDDYIFENIPEEKIAEVCGNLNLKKKKNNIFDTLKADEMVENNETILKDSDSKTIISEKIDRKDFSKYIKPLLDQRYHRENIPGVIELISPVVKQKKEGKGISWRGMYYGDDINFESVLILRNGEDIDFYMQDPDLKSQIYNRERVFASGDNMKIFFDISGDIKSGVLSNRSIYIKEVKNYNEDVIFHKERLKKQIDIIPDDQGGLFDNL